MATTRKLPCPSCLATLLIEPSQAGETVICPCGENVLVPPLRELRQLEAAERAPTEAPSRDWDVRRGLLFVGGVLLVSIGAVTTWQILPQRQQLDTRAPAFRELDIDVQVLTPTQAYEAWQFFRQQRLDYRSTPEFLENRDRYRELSGYLYAGWAVAGIGISLVLLSLLWRPKQARSTSQ